MLNKLVLMSAVTLQMAAQDVAGRYAVEGIREMVSELNLKTDGTFEYAMIYGAADYHARGAWRKDAGFVTLTTAGPAPEPFRMLSSRANPEGDMRVRVMGLNGRGVANIDVMLIVADGEKRARTDSQGIAMFAPVAAGAVRFGVRVYQFESKPYPVDPKQNDFTFEINGKAITEVRFENEKLRIDGERLEMGFWNPSRPMTFRKH
ncbi:MAG: hypothetical protein ABI823_20765 [Bryobacteraceae bacterium]